MNTKVLDPIETRDGYIIATLTRLDDAIWCMNACEYDDSDFAAPIEEQKAAEKKAQVRYGISVLSLYNMVSR